MPDQIFQKLCTALGYRPHLCLVYSLNAEGKCTCGNPTCRAKKHSNPSAPLYHIPEEGERYGVLCGESGIVVIDVDVKNGAVGASSLQATIARLGAPPTTLTLQTPSGGWHLYFRRPSGCPARDSKTVFGKDIDVKGSHRGLVIVDAPGGYQIVTDAPIATLPVAWANAMRVQVESRETAEAGTGLAVCDYADDPALLEWAREKFRKACRDKPGATEGKGGQGDMFPWQLALEARRLGLPPNESLPILLQLWNPKCSPPWATEGALAVDAQRGVPWLQRKIEGAWRGADVDCIGARFLRFAEEGFAVACTNIAASKHESVHATPEQEKRYLAAAHATSPVALVHDKPARRVHRADHCYSWQLPSLAASKGKKDKQCQAALQVLLSSDVWAGVFQHDAFADTLIAVDPPMELDAESKGLSNVDITRIQTWLESTGRTSDRKSIENAVEFCARENAFHPVREYLAALPDLVSIDHARYVLRETLARECFGVESELECTYVERTLIAAVRRVFSPGCEVHSMLVLVGRQDRFKSRALKALFGGGSLFKDQMPKLEGRDASHALHGKWGVEFSELGSIIRSDNATVKEFLSRAVDDYRQFGNGIKVVNPRQCVFFGTTNDDEFLRDETGNRRFWPIVIGREIDLERIVRMRDVFWSAARMLAEDGAPHWMTAAETAVAEPVKLSFVISDPWESEVERVAKILMLDTSLMITTTDILNAYAGSDRSILLKLGRREQMRVATVMKKLGYTNRVQWDNVKKKHVRAWESKTSE